jgi:dUTP pyrophosphatase
MTQHQVPVRVKREPGYQGDLPAYQSTGASGFDLRAQILEPVLLKAGARALIPTGLCFEIPIGYELQARPRSGLAIKNGISLVNTPGTIDADYRGEVKIIVINHSNEDFVIQPGERIAQMVLAPVVQAHFLLAETLTETDRGAGGFGSTGRA